MSRKTDAKTCAWLAASLLLATPGIAAELVSLEEHGLRVAPGFNVSLFADDDLAPDVYAMTLDVEGRPVVTSAGYIKTLIDTNADGRGDKSVTFAATKTGGMGLCFDGRDLLFAGDGALWKFRDTNGDAVADGPPEKIAPFKGGEHGGHAMRKGPDGSWYFIGGNSTGFTPEHATSPASPIKKPVAGAMMRFSPDLKMGEILAHGFRNPYDFDFNSDGEIFNYDSDVEREYFLPWYTPTRLYHVAHAMHHGWRQPGYMRSWDLPGDYADSVDWLQAVGRGSPTGVTVYRHTQFPEHYRNGLFYLDWTFGRVWFTPLTRKGASYTAKPEVFIEPIGSQGFAPTDVCVAPDGSLFISIGGRRTRGAVFKITAALTNAAPAMDELTSVLEAPQPLDAWSRVRWEPIARKLGNKPFAEAVANENLAEAQRVRAIEVLVDTLGGLTPAAERAGLSAKPALVRARTAWGIGRQARPIIGFQLMSLLHDPDVLVRRCVLETLADHIGDIRPSMVGAFLPENLNHPDKRVRQAVARLISLMPEKEWQEFWNDRMKFGSDATLSTVLAKFWREPSATVPDIASVETALVVFQQTKHDDTRAAAIRLIIRALGDWNLDHPSAELFTACELSQAITNQADLVSRITTAVRSVFPSTEEGKRDATFNAEAARLLAMLGDNDPQTPAKVMSLITAKSSATDDFHYLSVLAKLKAPLSGNQAAKLADALLDLDHKLDGAQQRSKQTWGERLTELARALIARSPEFATALSHDPRLAEGAHVMLAQLLSDQQQNAVASAVAAVVSRDKNFVWSPEVVRLLARLPEKDHKTQFRKQWSNRGIRDELITHLARNPERRDRDLFLEALDSARPATLITSVVALMALPPDDSPKDLLKVMQLLQRIQLDAKQGTLRKTLIALVTHETGQPFTYNETKTDAASLRAASQPVLDWFAAKHPKQAEALKPPGEEDPAKWAALLKTVNWSAGDRVRGESLFRERACQTCHAAANSLGPALNGVAARFSKEDLTYAMVFPSRDIAPQFQPIVFTLRDGQTVAGLVAFTSAEGVIVQTGPGVTARLATTDIVSQEPGQQSLMPVGLLTGLEPAQLADLVTYLGSLK